MCVGPPPQLQVEGWEGWGRGMAGSGGVVVVVGRQVRGKGVGRW